MTPALRRQYRSLFEVLTSHTIPIIDLSDFVDGDEASKEKVVMQVSEQCERIGFLMIRWNKIDTEIIHNAHDAASRFFSQSLEQKAKSSKSSIRKETKSFISTGYRATQTSENNKNRESWSCSAPEYRYSKDKYHTCIDGQRHFALPPDPQVPWPCEDDVPKFRSSICGKS